MNIKLRPITAEDMPFLLALYGTVREPELRTTDFNDQEKDDFVRQQFKAQHHTYTVRYPQARFDLILLNTQAIGRIYIDRRAHEIRVMDIALLPEWRNQGIGTRFMEQLQQEAERNRQTVTLHVEVNNPQAFTWYERLGFEPRLRNATHIFMVWPQGANYTPQI